MKTQTFLYALAGTTGTIDRGIVEFENKPLKTWAEIVREAEHAMTAAEQHVEYPVTGPKAYVTVPCGTVLSPELSKFLARSGVEVVGLV